MSDTESKPKEESDRIQLKVQFQDGSEELVFKLKKTTLIQKIYDAVAKQKEIAPGSFKLLLDGERLKGDHTIKMYEDLEDDTVIDMMMEQVGGSR